MSRQPTDEEEKVLVAGVDVASFTRATCPDDSVVWQHDFIRSIKSTDPIKVPKLNLAHFGEGEATSGGDAP